MINSLTLKIDISQEIKVEFTLGTAREFGIKICTGDAEETVIGYDAQAQEIFVDRRGSGDSSVLREVCWCTSRAYSRLSKVKSACTFLWIHAPWKSSATMGYTVISDLIFPYSQNTRLEFYALGGDVHLNKLEIWKLDVET